MDREALDAALRPLAVQRILWAAQLSAVVCFAVVALVVTPEAPSPVPALMAPLLGAVAAGVAVVSFVLPRMILANALRARALPVTDESVDEQTPAHLRFASPSKRVFADPVAALGAAVRTSQTALILGCGMSESVALFGLVYRMMGGDLRIAAPFFAAGAVLVAVRFPRAGSIAAALGRAYNAEPPRVA